jgi:hypothetical protein
MIGKDKILAALRQEAKELREWMSEHTSPDVPFKEFIEVANKYAIVCNRIHTIETQW